MASRSGSHNRDASRNASHGSNAHGQRRGGESHAPQNHGRNTGRKGSGKGGANNRRKAATGAKGAGQARSASTRKNTPCASHGASPGSAHANRGKRATSQYTRGGNGSGNRSGGNARGGRQARFPFDFPGFPLQASGRRSATAKVPQLGTIALFAVVAVVAIALVTSLHGCRDKSAEYATVATTSETTSAFDWTNLDTTDGRYAYYVDGNAVSRFGIDVSDSQGYIDWQQVANDGVEFAIVRVGYRGTSTGEVHVDEYFDYNIDSAKSNGIDVGVYFYSQAISEDEAREEAQLCLTEINNRKLQYPVVYDYEETEAHDGRADGISAEQAAANARAFCEAIEDAGYSAMIYGNPNDLSDYEQSVLDEYPIWYAEYGSLPTASHAFTMWQYTNQGSIAGIDTDVDLDIDLTAAL